MISDRDHLLNRPRSGGAFALWFLFFSAEAFAQVFSGSASLLSDYRYRGVSLSQNRPAAQLALAYDDASGWYGGAFASTVQLGYSHRELQAVSFAGYASRMPSGLSWEAGADYSVFTGSQSYDYAEMYVGVAYGNVSTRLYYAPRYFGQKSGAIYGEINASQPLLDRVRLLAHGGILRNSSENAYGQPAGRNVFDASVGVVIDFDQFSAQLSWVAVSSVNTPYPTTAPRNKNGAVLILSWSF